MKITIAICEDEQNIRMEILHLVNKHGTDFEVECYESGEALMKAGRQYDIYFLDIQMPGRNGLEIAKQIRRAADHTQSVIIFITALKEHIQAAFDVQAWHFLYKPLDESQFHAVLDKAAQECRRRKENGFVIIKRGGTSHSVSLNDILFVESSNKKVILHTPGGPIDYYGKIRDFEETADFFRCHRCYIVNLAHIVRYNATSIWVDDGQEISLAQSKYQEFVNKFMQYAIR